MLLVFLNALLLAWWLHSSDDRWFYPPSINSNALINVSVVIKDNIFPYNLFLILEQKKASLSSTNYCLISVSTTGNTVHRALKMLKNYCVLGIFTLAMDCISCMLLPMRTLETKWYPLRFSFYRGNIHLWKDVPYYIQNDYQLEFSSQNMKWSLDQRQSHSWSDSGRNIMYLLANA